MISVGDLIKLYDAVQSATNAEEQRRRASELDDAIERGIVELFDDPKYPRRRRSFGVIRKTFGGYFDAKPDQLRGHLIRVGAKWVKGDKEDALWHMPKEASNDQKQKSRNFVGLAFVVLAAILIILGTIGLFGLYPFGDSTPDIERWLRRD